MYIISGNLYQSILCTIHNKSLCNVCAAEMDNGCTIYVWKSTFERNINHKFETKQNKKSFSTPCCLFSLIHQQFHLVFFCFQFAILVYCCFFQYFIAMVCGARGGRYNNNKTFEHVSIETKNMENRRSKWKNTTNSQVNERIMNESHEIKIKTKCVGIRSLTERLWLFSTNWAVLL